jgi:hypothetical protein
MTIKSIETLAAELAQSQSFAKWAAGADDDEAPAALFYPKPTGKGVWSWKQQAAYAAEQAAAALKAAQAAQPKAAEAQPAAAAEEAEEDDGPRYVAPAESADDKAARLARWAAEGRNASGMLLNAAPCPTACCSEEKPKRCLSDEECQAAVDLFGWRHGAELIMAQNEGYSLDDLYGAEMQAAWDSWCAARRANAEADAAAEKARIEENWRRACVEQAIVEARRNLRRGEAVQKNGRICTRCYSCVGNKQSDWEDGGHRARPSTLHVSDVCFTHQAFLEGKGRDDCPFLHSGDAGWQKAWDTNFLWDPRHPEEVPVAKHVRSRQGGDVCISESSAGYLPVHLGGREQGMDARQWRQQQGGGGSAAAAAPQRPFAERAQPQGRFAGLSAAGGGGGPAAGGAWGRK